MGLVLTSKLTTTEEERGFNAARIGYQQLSGTITANSESVAYPATSVGNPLTYSYWRPVGLPASIEIDFGTVKAVDYFAIASHTLGTTGNSISIQKWDGSAWSNVYSAIAISDNGPIIAFFDEIQVSKVRLFIKAVGSAPLVGVIYTGKSLVMQRPIYGGHEPIALNRTTVYKNNASESGQWLGRSVRRGGAKTSFSWQNLTADWYRENFDPFVSAARFAPFFIAWRPFTFTNEVGYVWTNKDISPSNSGRRDFMSVSISVEGLAVD